MIVKNTNWQRWIYASIDKYIKEACVALTTPLALYIEGEYRVIPDSAQDWAELRVNGPVWHSGTNDDTKAEQIEINMYVLSKLNSTNNQRIHSNLGAVAKMLENTIPILKLGVGMDDDQSLLTCLQLDKDIKTQFLGQVNPTTQLVRGYVEATYFANF